MASNLRILEAPKVIKTFSNVGQKVTLYLNGDNFFFPEQRVSASSP
jgi:hypothetical protein